MFFLCLIWRGKKCLFRAFRGRWMAAPLPFVDKRGRVVFPPGYDARGAWQMALRSPSVSRGRPQARLLRHPHMLHIWVRSLVAIRELAHLRSC